MALVLTAFVALGETGELWNGPAGTPRCENLVQTWMDEFDENGGEEEWMEEEELPGMTRLAPHAYACDVSKRSHLHIH